MSRFGVAVKTPMRLPILTARLQVDRIGERWALYQAGLDAGGHDEATRVRLLAQSAATRRGIRSL